MSINEMQKSLLRQDFPSEALSADTSRGFELTSIKAAFVIERLNEVFGLCGEGWRYAHSSITAIGEELMTEVCLQYRVSDGGCGAYRWDRHNEDWRQEFDGEKIWSQPIFTHGGKKPLGKGGSQMTDAYKSAVTDGLTKAASILDIGHTVFKGLASKQKASSSASKQAQSANDDWPTKFYRAAKAKYGQTVPEEVVTLGRKAGNGSITWEEAMKAVNG